ncbi:phosphoglucomutase-like protein 5, partial [Pan paniscus]|uniref:phosphoglucomutase-like protein 5 n=1 Tax=Pan paniscus TaxID=9597 RepID=UPI0030050A76
KTSQIGCGLLTAASKEKTDAKPFINCKTVYNVCYYSQLSYCDQTLYKPAASQPYSQEVDNIWGRRSSRVFQDSSLDSLRPWEPQQDRPGCATEGSPIPVLTVPTAPYEDRRPAGGGGLQRPTGLLEGQRNYLPNFIQSVLSSIDLRDRRGCTTVVGSDGRYFSRTAIEIMVQMATANRIGRLIIGQSGILSTLAVSCIIRKIKAAGGIILTASHCPGGPGGEFGVKFNVANGGMWFSICLNNHDFFPLILL